MQAEPVRSVAAMPVLVGGDPAGSVLLLSDDPRLSIEDAQLGALKAAALYFGKQLES